jgi:uncharacterized membrane protein YbhN (UPF0104 family)
MLASDQTIADLALPSLDVRALARRIAIPLLLSGAALAGVLLAGGRVHAFADAIRQGLGVQAGWAAVGITLECASLAGYIVLLSLVAGRATARVGLRESAQVTLAGAAATRLLPTAGAGGAALALWTLRRSGLRSHAAGRTLLAFLVLLYSVFLSALAISGAVLALGLVRTRGPAALTAIPTAAALLAVAGALVLAFARRLQTRASARLLGAAVRDACRLARSGDPRLLGSIAYWGLDAATLWAMLHAFGAAPVIPVVVVAYFLGQVANTLPIPGSVSGGIAGVLIAFGVPAAAALPAVLTYRTVAVWLPTPVAIAAVPGLRSTVARWAREDAAVGGDRRPPRVQ